MGPDYGWRSLGTPIQFRCSSIYMYIVSYIDKLHNSRDNLEEQKVWSGQVLAPGQKELSSKAVQKLYPGLIFLYLSMTCSSSHYNSKMIHSLILAFPKSQYLVKYKSFSTNNHTKSQAKGVHKMQYLFKVRGEALMQTSHNPGRGKSLCGRRI